MGKKNKFEKSTNSKIRETEKMASGNIQMENLIPTVNKLQVTCNFKFDLPQIAVIGSQSAGKSSVLENIVGRDFLPRGSGIVTRRPLILQLINEKDEEEYGELCGDDSNEFIRYDDFDKIRQAIVEETDKVTGTNKGISDKKITLRIHSPKVLNLTLVDLPGITKVPVGDQPKDIEKQIRDMILEFINKENCLILAVSPANCDLANSDALKLAKEVDPEGLRTIGVLTKLDLMDEGTDARDIFEGRLLPLRRGYIGVVNRSQKDIEKKKNIAATLDAEHEFFIKHSYYKDIVDRLGTPYLQKVLNEQLVEHIRKTLPDLQDKSRKKLISLEKDINIYEKFHPDDPSKLREVILKAIQQLQTDFSTEMGSLGTNHVVTNRLSCGAKIRRIFHERLPDGISKIQPDEDKLRQEITYAIDNKYGIDGVLNTPFKIFEGFVKKHIEGLTDPIQECIDSVTEQLKKAVRNCIRPFSTYPKFRDYVDKCTMVFIRENSEKNETNILSLVKMQTSYMNSQQYEFKKNKQNGLVAALVEQTSMTDDLNSNQKHVLAVKLTEFIKTFIATENQPKTDDDVIREGILGVGRQSTAYVVRLKPKTLTFCFEYDPDDTSFELALEGLKFRLMKEDGDSIKRKIVLFKPNGGNVSNEPLHKELILSSKISKDIRLWRESLSLMIAFDDSNKMDPLEDDVDETFKEISSYMRIVKKTMCDMVPKAVTLFIIRELESFINSGLLFKVCGILNGEALEWFEADEKVVKKYKDMKEMRKAYKTALDIMEGCFRD